jgi:hypothetical protein
LKQEFISSDVEDLEKREKFKENICSVKKNTNLQKGFTSK